MVSEHDHTRSPSVDELRRELNELTFVGTDVVERFTTIGEMGFELLAEQLPKRPGFEGALIAGVLRGAPGDIGLRELRAAALGSGAMDNEVKGRSLLAFALRLGSKATPALVDSLGVRSPGVKWDALIGLAAVGDERAWDPVLSRLESLLRRPGRVIETPLQELLAVYYLTTHLSEDRPLIKVVRLVRKHLEKSSHRVREAFEEYWPELTNPYLSEEEIPPPNRARLREYFDRKSHVPNAQ